MPFRLSVIRDIPKPASKSTSYLTTAKNKFKQGMRELDNRIKAVKIGDRAAERVFKHPEGLRVHSLFKHAVNFISEDDFLITVLEEKGGAISQAILINSRDLCRLLSFNITPGEIININSLIDFSDVEIIHTQIPEQTGELSINSITYKLKICEECLVKFGKLSGFAASLLGKDNIYKKHVLKGLNYLKRAYFSKNKNEMASALCEFIGLGQGLTPSGDDFICGFITVFFYCPSITGLDNNWTRDMGLKVTEYAAKNTTLVSYNMLRACLNGEVSVHMQNLMKCILTVEDENLLPSIEIILQLGSTSGSDMISGVLYALHLIEKTEGLMPSSGGIK